MLTPIVGYQVDRDMGHVQVAKKAPGYNPVLS